MIGAPLARRLAALRCPDCGAVQPIYTSEGLKSRVRPAHYRAPCPDCDAPLHMVHTPGGAFREGLGWGLAFVALMGLALLTFGGDATPQGPGLWLAVGLGAVALYLFALVATGLILGRTRMMVKA